MLYRSQGTTLNGSQESPRRLLVQGQLCSIPPETPKAQKYTIRVEADFGSSDHDYKTDQVDVKVEKGAVTIVAAGDQSYYLGEEVKFSGTNTESCHNLPVHHRSEPSHPNGAHCIQPTRSVVNADVGSMLNLQMFRVR